MGSLLRASGRQLTAAERSKALCGRLDLFHGALGQRARVVHAQPQGREHVLHGLIQLVRHGAGNRQVLEAQHLQGLAPRPQRPQCSIAIVPGCLSTLSTLLHQSLRSTSGQGPNLLLLNCGRQPNFAELICSTQARVASPPGACCGGAHRARPLGLAAVPLDLSEPQLSPQLPHLHRRLAHGLHRCRPLRAVGCHLMAEAGLGALGQGCLVGVASAASSVNDLCEGLRWPGRLEADAEGLKQRGGLLEEHAGAGPAGAGPQVSRQVRPRAEGLRSHEERLPL
mmetsp:Transcript_36827/g.106158  ORF Transcript_36827/g.106158 Transcript_36827/m.106158 type:complete len:282 (+) Transcript_36827:107-952(+)